MALTGIFLLACPPLFSSWCPFWTSLSCSRYPLRMASVLCFRCSSASSYSTRRRRSILPLTGKVSTVSRNVTPRRGRRSGEESSSLDSPKNKNVQVRNSLTQQFKSNADYVEINVQKFIFIFISSTFTEIN